jgi:uncharacterized protein (DUF1330 family)
MAKAYVLGSLTVKHRSFTTNYAAKVDATLPPFEGKFLVRGGTIHYEEGRRSNVNVVLEFPSIEQMNNWFNSEAYQKIASKRRSTSVGEFIMIEGV